MKFSKIDNVVSPGAKPSPISALRRIRWEAVARAICGVSAAKANTQSLPDEKLIAASKPR